MSLLYRPEEVARFQEETHPERLVGDEDLENPLFYGFGTAMGKRMEGVIPRSALTIGEGIKTLAWPFMDYEQRSGWDAQWDWARDWTEATTLRPEEAGSAAQILSQGVQFIGDTALSALVTRTPVLLPTANAYQDVMRKMRKKGIEGELAGAVAGGDALNIAIGFAYAATGSSLLGRMVKGAIANEAADIPIGKAQQWAMHLQGRPEVGEEYDPLTGERVILNLGLGALSGIPRASSAYDAAAATRINRHYQDLFGTEQDFKAIETRGQIQDRMREIRTGATWTVGGGYKNPAFDAYIAEVEKLNNLPEGMLLAIKNAGEKSGVSAVSPKGARGVMQFMPDTAKGYGLRVDDVVDERLDPWKSMEAAGSFMDERMRFLGKKYGLKRNDPKLERAAIAWYIGGRNDAEGVILRGEAVDAEAIAYLQRTDAFKSSLSAAPRAADAVSPQTLTDIPDVSAPTAPPVSALVPQRVDAVAQAIEDAKRVPDVPGLALDNLGVVHAAKTNQDLMQAFAKDANMLQAGEMQRMRAAVLAKVYGEDVVPLLGEAGAKTQAGKQARALTDALLQSADAVARSKEKIGPDVAAAAVAAHKGAAMPADASPQGMLRTNLAAAFGKAKTSKQIQSAITKAVSPKGKARAAAEVATEADTFPRADVLEKPSVEAPDGTKVEIEDPTYRETAEELALEGRVTINDEGKAVSIADALTEAEKELLEAHQLAGALERIATTCAAV